MVLWRINGGTRHVILPAYITAPIAQGGSRRDIAHALVQWLSGAVVQWCSDAVVQWCSDAVVQWLSDAVVQ